jgi:long-chain acyl-CoA synthetase
MANFYNRFLQSVERWPDCVAVEIQRHSGELECLTYSELRQQAEALGSWLSTSGLERGSRCAILASNGPRWIGCYLGTVAAGMVTVPLDTAFSAEQVAKLLQASGSSLLFVDAKHLPVAQRAIADTPIRLLLLERSESHSPEPNFEDITQAGRNGFAPADAAGDDIAAILYTSGTTSDPKGVMLTHDNFHAETEGVFRLIDINTRDAILGVLPLFHALAQMANLLLPLAGGARIVFLESLNTSELLRALRERDITLFCCVPQFFYLIHERIQKEAGARGRLAERAFRWMLKVSRVARGFRLNLGKLLFRPVHATLGPKMRYFISGGSKLDPSIARDFYAMGFELLQGYGLTETTGGVLGTPPSANVIGSVGKPLGGVELKIRDPKSAENGTGSAIGEILLRGPLVMKGYYGRPEATAEVLRDGWLHTGDLGYLDAHGNVFITGREKDIIVLSNGKNVYPDEIEAHYLQSPYIKEICVLGLQGRPGEPMAERLHAVVVPDFEVLRERKIVNARQIIRFDIETLSAQLPSTKRFLGFDIWQDDLPRTTTRKIKRFEVERRVRESQSTARAEGEELARNLSEDEQQWLSQPDVARAIAVVSRAADGDRQAHPRDNLELDLGLDSMERVELLVALEQELGASVPDAVVSEVYTVRELIDVVRQSVGRSGRVQQRAAWDSILNQDPTDPEVLAVAHRRPMAERFWFLLSRLAGLFVRDRFGLTVTGVEKLPKHGPFIISPNHQSFLDPPVLISVLPYSILRDAFYVGTSEIFGNGVLRTVARSLKLIPVDPDANLVPAMRAGAYGLRHGKVLILYPEGERSIDGRPKVFKKGAAILATHLKVPICPVAMDGFFEAWPRGKGFQKFARLQIAFGDPIAPPQQVDNPEQTYESLTAELKARVMGMWLEMRNGQQRLAAD